MQLMDIAVQTSYAKSDHLVSKDFKEEITSMIAEARASLSGGSSGVDLGTSLWSKIKSVESDLSQTNWANKVVASFVVDDYRGRLPSGFLERFNLRRVSLSVGQTTGTEFEYPTVKDLLFFPSNIFELREFHGIEWQLEQSGSIRMPRMTFLGEDSDAYI
jgi:hypothetical protein